MKEMSGKRILMTLTRFDIGGAETHVLELSLELQRMGYHVVVASNGGVYENNLEEAGIAHYKVPMHLKTPSAVHRSLKLLKDIDCGVIITSALTDVNSNKYRKNNKNRHHHLADVFNTFFYTQKNNDRCQGNKDSKEEVSF